MLLCSLARLASYGALHCLLAGSHACCLLWRSMAAGFPGLVALVVFVLHAFKWMPDRRILHPLRILLLGIIALHALEGGRLPVPPVRQRFGLGVRLVVLEWMLAATHASCNETGDRGSGRGRGPPAAQPHYMQYWLKLLLCLAVQTERCIHVVIGIQASRRRRDTFTQHATTARARHHYIVGNVQR